MNKKLMTKLERQNYIHEQGFKFGENSATLGKSGVLDYTKVRIGNGKNSNHVDDVSVNLKTALNQLQ